MEKTGVNFGEEGAAMGHVQKLSTFLFVLALALLWGGSVRAASFSASLSVEEGRPGTPVEARFFYNGTLSGVAALRIDPAGI